MDSPRSLNIFKIKQDKERHFEVRGRFVVPLHYHLK